MNQQHEKAVGFESYPSFYYETRKDLRWFKSSDTVTYEVSFLISYPGFKLSKRSCFRFVSGVTTWTICPAEEIFFQHINSLVIPFVRTQVSNKIIT